MPCDTRLKRGQTIKQRADEVRKATAKIEQLLATGAVKAVVGPKGAFALQGLSEEIRDGITDACAYRRIMAGQSMTAKLAIMKAEQLAGTSISRATVASGMHSHDGGKTWHSGH